MATTSVHPTTPPRFRVRFVADEREHDAHAAFRTREDARAFCEALLENLDVSSAHVLQPCPQCGEHRPQLDGVDPNSLQCEDCTAEPLMSAQPWSVDPAYCALFTAEGCEQCGLFVNVPNEGLYTDDGIVLCHGCAHDGMSPGMWVRIHPQRTAR